ncbi:uncharacterized protein I303_104434 [Kwoniella dejecticola CBS 10117]|uniref:T-cell immunomodulatory protein TIP C2 domain-containing protein n=1 Tax=Kwoniella dejecticola CBS 10117 TaxID=1296121 RepID=A0A1A6A5C1_9TREE|nr:uncharacterized protein I303_04587 [Kwoniella dejecticola CBS 10117]OBR85254.1 hypothetical protein I303_04587 [Kwoniella dejecticola CBS 10117]
MLSSVSLVRLALLLSLLVRAEAIWPFKEKRFKDEAFINAGSLGLEGISGRVIGVGDWDGDQKLDLYTLNGDKKTVTINLWDKDKFKFTAAHTLTLSSTISNIIPGDYDHDGHLDLLVMYVQEEDGGWWGSKNDKLGMEVYLGGAEDGGFQKKAWKLDSALPTQPIVFDADSSLRPSLLGLAPSDDTTEGLLKTWLNNATGFTLGATPLIRPEQACTLAHPHSSAFIDIDGDCLPDLVLHCATPKSTARSIQIWLNKGKSGFELSRSYDLPRGSGPVSFGDLNRDGSIDIIFPTCAQTSKSTGIGTECNLNIAYNRQIPICSTEGSQTDKEGKLSCRGWGELCTADEGFEFSFDPSDPHLTSIPFSTLLADKTDTETTGGILLHPPNQPDIPLPIRVGDYNVDGFPDLLLTVHTNTKGGVLGTKEINQVKVLVNVPCSKNVPGCEGRSMRGKRGFKVRSGKAWDALDGITDAEGASWMDIDDDGSLDILVQRSGSQSGERVTFIQNNIYHDAFFLKAQVLNGACEGKCELSQGGKSYNPLGVSYSGATYKFTVLDTEGHRVAQQVAQLPQTGYHSLHNPYAYFGLGRTNNYVEKLFIGTSLPQGSHSTYLESIIPNSQIIINPPYPVSPDDEQENPEPKNKDDVPSSPPSKDRTQAPVKARSTEWKSQLYLKPGDWVPWVGVAVFSTTIILGFVVLGLNEREKKEDEKERRRKLHAINFQAL